MPNALEQGTEPFAPSRLEQDYLDWRNANPEAVARFRAFARQMLEAKRRFGMKQLAERVRWESRAACVRGRDGFRINNNHIAYLARDLVREMPGLAALIEIRVTRSEALQPVA